MENTVVSDICLLDFYEKKYMSSLYSIEQLAIDHKETHNEKEYCEPRSITDLRQDIAKIPLFFEYHDEIYDILAIDKRKISICGISVENLLYNQDEEIYDIYFHSCDVAEAKKLLQQCMGILWETANTTHHLKESNCIRYVGQYYSARIHLEVFKDRNQILRFNGTPPEKCGFDLEVGYFCTTSNSILSLKSFDPCCPGDLEEDVTYVFHNIDRDIIPNITKIEIFAFSLDDKSNRLHYANIKEDVRSLHFPNNFVEGLYSVYDIEMKPFLPKPKIKIDIKKYLGEKYKPIVIGISDDRFVVFYHCKILYNLGNDIFRLLCDVWLESEATQAKERLLRSY